jgi:hypothetical protein
MPNNELAYLKPYAKLALSDIALGPRLTNLFYENERSGHRLKFHRVGDLIARVEQFPSLGHLFLSFADWTPQDVRTLRRVLYDIPKHHAAHL